MTIATLLEFRPEFFQIRQVGFAQTDGINQSLVGGFERVEAGPVAEREFQFVPIPYLKDDDFMPCVAEVGECGKKLVV